MSVRRAICYTLMASMLNFMSIGQAFAGGNVVNVKIDALFVLEEGVVIISTTHVGPISGAPACASVYQYAFKSNTLEGQGMLATFLSAKFTDSLVTIYGKNVCTARIDAEDVANVRLYALQ